MPGRDLLAGLIEFGRFTLNFRNTLHGLGPEQIEKEEKS